MKYLLDTQMMIWLFGEPAKIGARHLKTLADPQNELFVSAASTWEVAIKVAIGKLKLPETGSIGRYLTQSIRRAGLATLPISVEHTYEVAALPRHHGDPFDRLLVAQATVERMTIATSDRTLRSYRIPTLIVS